MFFRKKIQRQCSYCEYATSMDELTMLCSKKGVVPAVHKCTKFSYDPCKRIPPRPKAPDFEKYNEEDYTL